MPSTLFVSCALAAVLVVSAENVQTVDALKLRTFGTGRSQITVRNDQEFPLYNYTLSGTATHGLITHWWITGGKSDVEVIDVAHVAIVGQSRSMAMAVL